MGRERVEFLDVPVLSLAPDPLTPGEVGSRSTFLSRDPDSGAQTRFVQVAPYWHWQPSEPLGNDLEILVLEGSVSVDDWEMGRGAYLHLSAGTQFQRLTTTEPCAFLWMINPVAGDAGKTAPEYIPNINEVPWVPVPDFEGRPASEVGDGLRYKMLRQDPVTSAYTLVSHMAADWFDPRLEAHETWEELVLLEGDFLMGVAGRVTGGTYIFRSGEKPHGPQATRTGAVWFARGEKQIDFDFSESDVAKTQTALYMAADDMSATTNLQPWGSWT